MSTIEALDPKDRAPGGINDWRFLREMTPSATVFDSQIARTSVINGILVGRLTASTLLVVSNHSRIRQASAAYVALSHALLGKQTINGGDGADQMAAIILGASAIGRSQGGANQDLATSFISAQLILSYFVSGFTKIFGPEWRNGVALERVMRTHAYGDADLYILLRRNPKVGEFITHFTVALETAFPLLVLNRRTRLAALAAMGGFHAVNARLMGLGRFMLCFIAAYPSLLRTMDQSS
ncbi:HTTM domain-containing protein [Actinomyces sp. 2119]|uniref:HTTM domain-containing protein n=1 Tax=Actinomyces sp. 2119 TaxID=2321393 RepID=UPI0015FFC971|nr:HTTM domain-containing protein [Actinomyces sp. 2119]